MTRKIVRAAPAASGGNGVKSHEIVAAIREGRLTRRQFDAWHTQRRGKGKGIVITLREKPSHPVKRSTRKHKGR